MSQKLLPSLILCALCASGCTSIAQTSDEDDVFELSPFTVASSGYRGYGSSWAKQIEVDSIELGVTSAQLRNPLMQPYPSNGHAPISITKPVTEISLRFAYSFYNDSESIRRKTLQALIDEVILKTNTQTRIQCVPERLVIKKGDRAKSLRKRRSEYTSHAYFSLSIQISEDEPVNQALSRARAIVETIEIDESNTRLFHGEIDWIFRMKNEYRNQLIDAISQDLAKQRELYGTNYEISLTPLHSPIQAKLVSETQAQLWIPYTYNIQSLHQLEQQRSELELQHAQKWIQIAADN